ncbi:MAG: glycosyltransferase [Candidatus Bathyarchaeota archaeon]|nr:glycosyltransferase [Candidatus Bathyarchaeota archaeon]
MVEKMTPDFPKPKITVGMCLKNSELTVKEALDSVLNQDFPHELIEIIIVDGYSRDKTLEIVRGSIGNADIQTKIFQENQGLGKARQMVVDEALGDYIVWVDGDMVLSKEFLRKQFEFMNRNLDAGIAKGKYGVNLNRCHESLVAALENVEFLVHTMSEGKTSAKSLGASGCIYRTEAIRGVGGFDTSIKGAGEDNDVEYRMRVSGWSIYITAALFYEKRRQTWSALWQEYFWHGYGWPSLLRKNRASVDLLKFLPPVAVMAEFLRLPKAYFLTRQKKVLLLPLHYAFKRTAWILGLIRSHLNTN